MYTETTRRNYQRYRDSNGLSGDGSHQWDDVPQSVREECMRPKYMSFLTEEERDREREFEARIRRNLDI